VSSLLAFLDDPNPAFACSNLSDIRSPSRFRVPVRHSRIHGSRLARWLHTRSLPKFQSVQQLLELVKDGSGWALFRPAQGGYHGIPENHVQQRLGSILIGTPAMWRRWRKELGDWTQAAEETGFDSLACPLADALPFAKLNFSPDVWYIALSGTHAGSVFRWEHDTGDDYTKPWASDLVTWGKKLRASLPDAFTGIIRFNAAASVDVATASAELYPERYLADVSAERF